MRYIGTGNGTGVYDLSTYTWIGSSCSGTSGSTSLTATNASFSAGQRIFIHQTRGGANVNLGEDNKIVSYTAGTITLLYPLERDYTDSGSEQAQVVVVPEVGSTTGSITVDAWDGDVKGLFVIAVSGTFDGTVNAVGKGFRGGTGGANEAGGGDMSGYTGEGTVGASIKRGGGSWQTLGCTLTYNDPNGNGGGAGIHRDWSASDAGAGGGGGSNGGDGTTGEVGQGCPGIGATAVSHSGSTMVALGGGGGGGAGEGNGTANGGAGGRGGGAVIVYASNIAETASILTGGNVGSNVSGGSDGAGGGGGGAGGTILVRSVKTTLGASKLLSSGGAGGSVNGSGGDGGAGGDGYIRIESCSVSGTTTPSASKQEGGLDYCGGAAFIY
jgi:hypothetical protein